MKIVTVPNKILKKKSKPIDKIDQKILDLIDEMWQTLGEVKGVGLAAPQIGESISLAIVGFEPTKDQLEQNPDLQPVPQKILINPKIIWCSKDKDVDKEACLSVPKVEIDIERNKKIHVQFLDEKGKKQKIKARGYIARALQHEIDHLNGILITDYK